MAENFVFKQTGAELQAIIDAVETIDQTPTAGSKNPVESGGVAAVLEGVETALQGVDDALDGVDGRLDGVDARLDDVDTALAGKQETLVSGTNIKTINGESVLGAGDLRVGDANAVKNLAGSASAYTTVIKAGNSYSMAAEVRMVDASVKVQAAGGSVEVNASGVALQAGNSGAPNAKVTYNGQEVATKKYVDDAIEAIDVTDQIAGKADKVTGAVTGDFAGLDAQGNLVDSGKMASDFATAAQGAKADAAIKSIVVGNTTTGAPGTSASVVITGTGENIVLNFTIPRGDQGNSGSSVDYPYILVNNLTTNDATQALSAAMGFFLKNLIDQINQRISYAGALAVNIFRKAVYKDNDAENDILGLEETLVGVLSYIDAVYTQPGTIYVGQSIEDLRYGLSVTAVYLDGTVVSVENYTLTGILTVGSSNINVAYGGKTTTFTVSVTDAVHYRDNSGNKTWIAYNVAPRAAFTSANRSRAATIDGTVYYFTQSGSSVATAMKRSVYYLFDLLLTAGKTYKYELYVNGLESGQQIYIGLPYYTETFRVAGVANSNSVPQNYSDQIFDSGWLTPTYNNGVLTVIYETPANMVGTRINLKVESGGSDIDWPSTLTITRFAISEVTE